MLIVDSYIHGGAWRDPRTNSEGFQSAVENLWKSPTKESIAGFASINYRLSSNPTHSEDPSLSEDPSRNVVFPNHLVDVGNALLYLDKKYSIADRYLLIGHSAGATMTFELHNSYFKDETLPLPAAVLGISGIYDFEGFLAAHSHPAYREFMEGAFPDRSTWEQASPYTSKLLGASWESAKVIVISHSDDDELVEKGQADAMLERVGKTPDAEKKVHFLTATGKHDEIWESGYILAGLITRTVKFWQDGA